MAHYKAILISSFNRNAFNLISWKAGKFWFEKQNIHSNILTNTDKSSHIATIKNLFIESTVVVHTP